MFGIFLTLQGPSTNNDICNKTEIWLEHISSKKLLKVHLVNTFLRYLSLNSVSNGHRGERGMLEPTVH